MVKFFDLLSLTVADLFERIANYIWLFYKIASKNKTGYCSEVSDKKDTMYVTTALNGEFINLIFITRLLLKLQSIDVIFRMLKLLLIETSI